MKLGERMDVVAMTIQGHVSIVAVTNLVEEIIKSLNMHKAYDSIVHEYPLNGLGGNGFTYHQSITESFIDMDAWPDYNGGYLVICSCKTINLNKVSKKIRSCGYKIKQIFAKELSLRKSYAI